MQKRIVTIVAGFGLLALAAGSLHSEAGQSAGIPTAASNVSAPPADNDAALCNDGEGQVRIDACTRIIKTGRLFGKTASRSELATVYNIRGSAFSDMHRYDNAIADYEAAIGLNPQSAKAYYNRGVAYASSGRPTQAISDYDAAIRLKPGLAVAYFSRANAYDALSRYDRAIASFDAAVRLSPGYTAAYANRGIVHAKKGDRARAVADFRRALILDPSDPVAKSNLAQLGLIPRDRSARVTSGNNRTF